MKELGAIAVCLLLAGCAAKRPVTVDALLPVSCVREPIRMIGCNPELTKCKSFYVNYAKGCPIVELKPTRR